MLKCCGNCVAGSLRKNPEARKKIVPRLLLQMHVEREFRRLATKARRDAEGTGARSSAARRGPVAASHPSLRGQSADLSSHSCQRQRRTSEEDADEAEGAAVCPSSPHAYRTRTHKPVSMHGAGLERAAVMAQSAAHSLRQARARLTWDRLAGSLPPRGGDVAQAQHQAVPAVARWLLSGEAGDLPQTAHMEMVPAFLSESLLDAMNRNQSSSSSSFCSSSSPVGSPGVLGLEALLAPSLHAQLHTASTMGAASATLVRETAALACAAAVADAVDPSTSAPSAMLGAALQFQSRAAAAIAVTDDSSEAHQSQDRAMGCLVVLAWLARTAGNLARQAWPILHDASREDDSAGTSANSAHLDSPARCSNNTGKRPCLALSLADDHECAIDEAADPASAAGSDAAVAAAASVAIQSVLFRCAADAVMVLEACLATRAPPAEPHWKAAASDVAASALLATAATLAGLCGRGPLAPSASHSSSAPRAVPSHWLHLGALAAVAGLAGLAERVAGAGPLRTGCGHPRWGRAIAALVGGARKGGAAAAAKRRRDPASTHPVPAASYAAVEAALSRGRAIPLTLLPAAPDELADLAEQPAVATLLTRTQASLLQRASNRACGELQSRGSGVTTPTDPTETAAMGAAAGILLSVAAGADLRGSIGQRSVTSSTLDDASGGLVDQAADAAPDFQGPQSLFRVPESLLRVHGGAALRPTGHPSRRRNGPSLAEVQPAGPLRSSPEAQSRPSQGPMPSRSSMGSLVSSLLPAPCGGDIQRLSPSTHAPSSHLAPQQGRGSARSSLLGDACAPPAAMGSMANPDASAFGPGPLSVLSASSRHLQQARTVPQAPTPTAGHALAVRGSSGAADPGCLATAHAGPLQAPPHTGGSGLAEAPFQPVGSTSRSTSQGVPRAERPSGRSGSAMAQLAFRTALASHGLPTAALRADYFASSNDPQRHGPHPAVTPGVATAASGHLAHRLSAPAVRSPRERVPAAQLGSVAEQASQFADVKPEVGGYTPFGV